MKASRHRVGFMAFGGVELQIQAAFFCVCLWFVRAFSPVLRFVAAFGR